jgi:hypothetical protein
MCLHGKECVCPVAFDGPDCKVRELVSIPRPSRDLGFLTSRTAVGEDTMDRGKREWSKDIRHVSMVAVDPLCPCCGFVVAN